MKGISKERILQMA